MLDHHVPLGAELLRLHVVLLGEALFDQLERPRNLGERQNVVERRPREQQGSAGQTMNTQKDMRPHI